MQSLKAVHHYLVSSTESKRVVNSANPAFKPLIFDWSGFTRSFPKKFSSLRAFLQGPTQVEFSAQPTEVPVLWSFVTKTIF
jgi:hypothetical protein